MGARRESYSAKLEKRRKQLTPVEEDEEPTPLNAEYFEQELLSEE